MIRVTDALRELGVTDWTLIGEPTNETEFYENFKKVVGADSDNNAILSSDQTKFGTTWGKVEAKLNELKNAEPMKILREERNRKLAETDWWANSDLTMTDAQKKYRKDLRDFPSSGINPKLKENGPRTIVDPSSVTWPTKP